MSVQRVLPTLTEVIEIAADDLPQRLAVAALPPESVAIEDVPDLRRTSNAAHAPAAAPGSPASVVLPPHFEERVQALLAPRMARLVDSTLQSLRTELALEVQVLVREAIDEALAEMPKA